MPIISEDNIIQIKLKMVVWIAGIMIAVFGTLASWQQIQISNLKVVVKELEEKKVDENGTRIYVIKSEDIPQVFRVISVHQSQLNTLNQVIFGTPIETNIGLDDDLIIPTLPGRD